MPSLIVTDTRNDKKQTFHLDPGGTLTLGRMEGQDVVLTHQKVSRRHARLTEEEGIFKIVDVGSSNGTFLNGKRLNRDEETIIFAGDEVRLGEFVCTVQEGDVEAKPAAETFSDADGKGLKAKDLAAEAEPATIEDKEPSTRLADEPSTSSDGSEDDIEEEEPAKVPTDGRDTSPAPAPTIDQPESSKRIDDILDEYADGDLNQQPAQLSGPIDLDALVSRPKKAADAADLLASGPKVGESSRSESILDAILDGDENGSQASKEQSAATAEADGFDADSGWDDDSFDAADVDDLVAADPAPRKPLVELEAVPAAKAATKGSTAGFQRARQRTPRRMLSDEERKKLEIIFQLKNEIQDRILQYMDLRNLDFTKAREEDLRERTRGVIRDIIGEMSEKIPRWASKKQLAKEVLDEALGLGPLEDLLDDDTITEIMVNSAEQVYVERAGRLEEAPVRFSSSAAVMAVIERIVGPIGRRIDESSPMVDARLKDGSRVNAIIPPLALKGPSITIRKFSKTPFTLDDLVAKNSLTPQIASFLQACVGARLNLVVSGGTGSGKTTLLNVLSNFIPHDERIVTIENVAELQLGQDHVVGLESRPPNIEGRGEVSVRELVKNSLRMRPDRIVVGECRGGEAIDMIQAMNTGHDGSLTTLHSNTPQDTLHRLETMSMMAGFDLPVKAIREQIMAAVHLIVHTNRFSDGTRRVTHVTEVLREVDEHYRIQTKDIFKFVQEGIADDGAILGGIRPTGYLPSFLYELSSNGFAVDETIFEAE